MLKWRYPCLNDKDFLYEEGQEGMLDKLSGKIKKTREELSLLFAEMQTY